MQLAMILWWALRLPCVLMVLCCGCGTLRNDKAPPVAKQLLYGVDAIGTGVAVVTSPVWVPVVMASSGIGDAIPPTSRPIEPKPGCPNGQSAELRTSDTAPSRSR